MSCDGYSLPIYLQTLCCFRISCSSSLHEGYDEPEILRYENLKSVPQALTSDTVEYDKIGRPIKRLLGDRVSKWIYDASPHGIGKISSILSSDGYSEHVSYDRFGRIHRRSKIIDRETFSTTTEYDQYGRLTHIYYPTGFSVENRYDSNGFHVSTNETFTGDEYWRALSIDQYGRVSKEQLGNGIISTTKFSEDTGHILSISSGSKGSSDVLDLQLEYDLLGNLTRRVEGNLGVDEQLGYDDLNRLVAFRTSDGQAERYRYDASGRMTFKSGVGEYVYADDGPHHAVAMTELNGVASVFGYDANGNMVSSPEGAIEYTDDNRVSLLFESGQKWSRFDYSPDGQRYRHTERAGRSTFETIYAGMYERLTDHTGLLPSQKLVRHRHFLVNGSGVFAAIESTKQYAGAHLLPSVPGLDGASTIEHENHWYFHKNELGSVVKITDEAGKVRKSFWYDPWGKRQAYSQYNKDVRAPGQKLGDSWAKGFTGHDHVDDFNAVHMNGRVFNFHIAAFTSGDPIGVNQYSTQGLNPYSYAENRPTFFVDPTGYFRIPIVSDIVDAVGDGLTAIGKGIEHFVHETGKWLEENWREVVVIVVVVAIAAIPEVNVIALGVIAGAVGGGLSTALYGGDFGDVLAGAFKEAVIGGISAGIGAGIAGGELSGIGAYAARGAVGGISYAANGGDFWTGVGFGLAAHAAQANLYGTETYQSSPGLRIATTAAIGGTASQLSGNKFANGAITGAFQATLIEASRVVQQREYRTLTSREVNKLYEVYGENLDYDSIRVVKGRYMIFQPDNVAMTPDGNMYFPSDIYMGDFAIGGLEDVRLFVHESVHVWQYQSGVNVAMKGLYLHTFGGVFSDPYQYSPYQSFGTMNIEQQGNYIRDLFHPRRGDWSYVE